MKGRLLATAESFVLREAICPLPNVFQEGEWSLPGWPRRSLYHFVWAPLTQLPLQATALLCWKLYTSQTQSLSSAKNLNHSIPPAPQYAVREWGGVSSCVNRMLHSSIHHCLSPFSLPTVSVPILQLSGSFSLPKLIPCTCHLTCCLSGKVEVFLPILSSISLVPNDPISIQLCLRDGRAKVPLPLHYLYSPNKIS